MELVVKDQIFMTVNVNLLTLIVEFNHVKSFRLLMIKKFVILWIKKIVNGELNLVNNQIVVTNIILLIIIVVNLDKCGIIIHVLQYLVY